MEYSVFRDIFNKQIFDNSKRDLIEKIAEHSDRYTGLFRPTKPKAKILQNLLQSNEIRFGDALEILFEKYFELLGYVNLEKKISTGKDYLDADQLFKDHRHIYFVEQKVRDDHDSTKKRGQIANFEKKINVLLSLYQETELKCYTYFIDPCLTKNKRFYCSEIEKIKKDHAVSAVLCYGKEFWQEIEHPEIWDELLQFLEQWKEDIPDMPSINFDEYPEQSFEEIKQIEVSVFRKLFANETVCKEILPILFPEKKVLKLLYEYFSRQTDTQRIFKTLAEKVKNFLKP